MKDCKHILIGLSLLFWLSGSLILSGCKSSAPTAIVYPTERSQSTAVSQPAEASPTPVPSPVATSTSVPTAAPKLMQASVDPIKIGGFPGLLVRKVESNQQFAPGKAGTITKGSLRMGKGGFTPTDCSEQVFVVELNLENGDLKSLASTEVTVQGGSGKPVPPSVIFSYQDASAVAFLFCNIDTTSQLAMFFPNGEGLDLTALFNEKATSGTSPTTAANAPSGPVSLEISYSPNPAHFQTGGASSSKYTCSYKTTVKAVGGAVTITGFQMYYQVNGSWEKSPSNNGQPWSANDFRDWYSCGTNMILLGQSCSDPSNWNGSSDNSKTSVKWVYYGVDGQNNPVQGEQVIECLP